MIALAHARALLTAGKDMMALRELAALQSHTVHGPLATAMTASAWASIGARQRARTLTASLRDSKDPIIRYMLGVGAIDLREWDEGIEHLTAATQAAPGWVRATAPLADAMLARGRVDEAAALLEDAHRGPLRDASIDVMRLALLSARGANRDVVAAAELVRARWPRRLVKGIAVPVAFTLRNLDDLAAARDWGLMLGESFAAQMATPRSRFVSLDAPLYCQEPMMCLPVCVSLVAAIYGKRFDPVELYSAMRGYGGTVFPNMQEVVNARGFDVHCIRPKPALLRRLLDEGRPIIGPRYGIGSAHVEVICGYDEALSCFYVRDPESWQQALIHQEMLSTRYQEQDGVLLLVPKGQPVTLDASDLSLSFRALIDLEAALLEGDAATAKTHIETIDNPSTRMLAAWASAHTLMTHTEIGALERAAVKDAAVSIRLRAMIAMQGSVEIDEGVFEIFREVGIDRRHFVMQMIEARQAMRDGLWETASRLCDALIDSVPGLPAHWQLASVIANARGEIDRSEHLLSVAYDIEPTNHGIASAWRDRVRMRRPFAQASDELCKLWQTFPSVHSLWYEYFMLLTSGSADGSQIEELGRGWVARFPKSLAGWHLLTSWLRTQGREDLVTPLLIQARRNLGVEADGLELSAASPVASVQAAHDPDSSHATDSKSSGLSPRDATADSESSEPDTSATSLSAASIASQSTVAGSIAELNPTLLPRRSATGSSVDSDERHEAKALMQAVEAAVLDLSSDNALLQTQLARLAELERGRHIEPTSCVRIAAWRHLHAIRTCNEHSTPAPPEELALGVPLAEEIFCREFESLTLSARHALKLLEWLEHRLSGLDAKDALAIVRAKFAVMCARLSHAQHLLELHIEKHPADSRAVCELADVFWMRGDRRSACAAFERALELHPGNERALRDSVLLWNQLGDDARALDVQRRLVARRPRSAEEAARLVDLLKPDDPFPAALFGPQLSTGQIRLLRSRFALRRGQPEIVLSLLADEEDFSDLTADQQRERVIWKLIAYERKEGAPSDTAFAFAEQAAERYGDNAVFWRVRIKLALRRDDIPSVLDSIAKAAAKGLLNREMLEFAFQAKAIRVTDARSMIRDSAPDFRDACAQAWAGLIRSNCDLHEYIEFLSWCESVVPDSRSLRVQLVHVLNFAKRPKHAAETARRLLDDSLSDPEMMVLLADTLQASNEREAADLYMQAWELAGLTSALEGLAGLHHNAGRRTVAKRAYWTMLRLDPLNEVALTNLYVLGEERRRLGNYFQAVLESGGGTNGHYFAVAAVEIARSCNTKVHPRWHEVAQQRVAAIKQDGTGHGDELEKLQSYLAEWSQASVTGSRSSVGPSLSHALAPTFHSADWVPATRNDTRRVPFDSLVPQIEWCGDLRDARRFAVPGQAGYRALQEDLRPENASEMVNRVTSEASPDTGRAGYLTVLALIAFVLIQALRVVCDVR